MMMLKKDVIQANSNTEFKLSNRDFFFFLTWMGVQNQSVKDLRKSRFPQMIHENSCSQATKVSKSFSFMIELFFYQDINSIPDITNELIQSKLYYDL